MAALTLAPEPEPHPEPEPEPEVAQQHAGQGIVAVVLYDYEVYFNRAKLVRDIH